MVWFDKFRPGAVRCDARAGAVRIARLGRVWFLVRAQEGCVEAACAGLGAACDTGFVSVEAFGLERERERE